MNEQQMRSWLKNRQPHSILWHERVDRMSVEQVTAIYLRMQGEPEKAKIEVSPNQLTLF